MDRVSLFTQVAELIQQHSTKTCGTLSDDTRLEDLGVDSIDLMEIVFRLEEVHGTEISIEGLRGRDTLGEIVDYAFSAITV